MTGAEIFPGERFPDPLISANLYASGRLDRTIDRFVIPFWRLIAVRGHRCDCYLWILRYARCGEHLKLRVHGPETLRGPLMTLLEETVLAYSARAPEEEILPRLRRSKPAPPLDLEDQAEVDYPDGTFLRTRYLRSPIILGASPLLRDDRYAALFTTCLGRACDLVLGSFELGENGRMPHTRRQALLLRILATGLSAVFPATEGMERYIAYHRDWLVRGPTLLLRGRMAKARQILERFNIEAASLDPARLARLGRLLRDAESMGPEDELWRQSMVTFSLYLQGIQGCDPDPFVQGPLYPSLFKIFHCVANQLGLSPLNEGLAWHLLLKRFRGDDARDHDFQLIPSL